MQLWKEEPSYYGGDILHQAKKEKIQKAKDALAKDIARTSGKLSNQGFLAKAPEAVVAKEKEKLATFEEKMKSLDERLQFLEKLG